MADPTNAGAPEPRVVRHEGEIENWLVSRIAALTGLDESEIETGTPFFELGLDSKVILELASALTTWLGRPIDATAAWNYPNIKALAGHLVEPSHTPEQRAPTRDSSTAPAPAPEPSAPLQLLAVMLEELYES